MNFLFFYNLEIYSKSTTKLHTKILGLCKGAQNEDYSTGLRLKSSYNSQGIFFYPKGSGKFV